MCGDGIGRHIDSSKAERESNAEAMLGANPNPHNQSYSCKYRLTNIQRDNTEGT